MATDAITGNLPLGGNGLALGGSDDNALATVLDFMLPGMTFEQAVEEAVRQGALEESAVGDEALNEQFEQLSPSQQRQLGERSEQLPPALRETTERHGQTNAADAANNRQAVRTDATTQPNTLTADLSRTGVRTDAASAALVSERLGVLSARTGEAVQRPALDPQTASIRSADQANELQQPQLLVGRLADAVIPVAARDAPVGQAIQAIPDRPQGPQNTSAPGHTAVAQGGRGEGSSTAQLAAGASLIAQGAVGVAIAQPQGAVSAIPTANAPQGHVNASTARVQERLSPAGHTQATGDREGGRKGASASGGSARGNDSTLSLLSALRKRNGEADEEATSSHWLFWLLTIAAYGALAVALIAMVPSGGALTDNFGRPTFGVYALVVGAVAALGSWWLGRKLFRR